MGCEGMPLSEPFEILELADGQTIRLRIANFEWGEAVIHPRYPGAPVEKRIPVLRLYVPADYKPRGPPYWDVTSKTLQAQLKPLLEGLKASGREVVITAHGVPPSKRFTLRVE
jgi:hypothetical protein